MDKKLEQTPKKDSPESDSQYYGYNHSNLRLRSFDIIARRYPDIPLEEVAQKAQEVYLWAIVKNVTVKK